MKCGYTTLATDWNEREMKSFGARFIKALLFFIPRDNKDNEKSYPCVRKWLIEVDDFGVPNREIGLDENDIPLFTAPNDRNYGLWTDGNKIFSESELALVENEFFESMWSKVASNA